MIKSKLVQELEKNWVTWHDSGTKAFVARLHAEAEARTERVEKGKRSWDSIKVDLPDGQNDGSQTVVDGSLVHMDPWERVVGVV